MEPFRLTILPLLARWDHTAEVLSLNVMTIPVGDPRMPLTAAAPGVPAAPSFTGADISLRPHISTDLTTVPTIADVPAESLVLPLAAPGGQTAIFDQLAAQFNITQPQQRFERQPGFRLRKYLPQTYRSSFSFVTPKTALAVIDDSYFCALRCPPETPPADQTPETDLSWGEVLAMTLRQPALARAVGLIHSVSLSFPGGFDGGWIFFTLAPNTPFEAQAAGDPDYLRLYATRVPALPAAQQRPVFTAVSFPVAADAAAQAALGPLDQVFDEAVGFDDGFAKIVHARQPDSSDLIADDGQGLPLYTDPGIQLGWDDEDLLIGMNRGVSDNPDGTMPADAPSSVMGYRVDVRESGTTAWTSLCRISGPNATFAGVSLGALDGELNVEVHPVQVDQQFWLPSYYTRWEGGSLVAPTDETRAFAGNPPRLQPLPYAADGADAVPLRYGRDYEFRVRLADTAGNGPDAAEEPENTGEAPVAALKMRRKLRPRPVEVDDTGPDADRPTSVKLRRPRLGYPAALFSGHPGALTALQQIVATNAARPPGQQMPIEIPDPDAELLEVNVYVEMPAYDAAGGRDGLQLLSRSYRAFPALTDPNSENALFLTLEWVTAPRLSDHTWTIAAMPVADTGPIMVPTARNVRIEVRAVGQPNLHYFAERDAAFGQTADLWEGTLRVAEPEPAPVLGQLAPETALASVFLQPANVAAAPTRVAPSQTGASPLLIKRLAAALDLQEDGGALYALPGRRVIFSCNGLQHQLPPDASSLALTSIDELPRLWISALRIPIERDWSWIGLETPGFKITRTIQLVGSGGPAPTGLADIAVRHAVNLQASEGQPDRERFELIVIDAFAPPLDGNGLPNEVEVTYEVVAIEAAPRPTPDAAKILTRLPVASPPRVAPRLVSAGHALGPYTRLPDYAETGDRSRLLWLEFTENPRKDPRDTLYSRILAVAPDPMLLPDYESDADAPQLAQFDLDPETVRVIRPGQPEDFAGLSAMQAMIPSEDSPLHYAMPLPPSLGPDSPELFGFFTVEFRVGHPRSTPSVPFWSTAQGRFGPPLVMEGVQFPAPRLQLAIAQYPDELRLSAEYAQPVRAGRRILVREPNTELWFVLYARVMQVDGATRRNIPILRQQAQADPNQRPGLAAPVGRGLWLPSQITAGLKTLGLPEETPLSALAVELNPEPNSGFGDPLGRDLGEVRILRTSRLVEVPQDCCAA